MCVGSILDLDQWYCSSIDTLRAFVTTPLKSLFRRLILPRKKCMLPARGLPGDFRFFQGITMPAALTIPSANVCQVSTIPSARASGDALCWCFPGAVQHAHAGEVLHRPCYRYRYQWISAVQSQLWIQMMQHRMKVM